MKNFHKASVSLALLTAALGPVASHAQTFVQTTVTDSGQTTPVGLISQLDNSGSVSGSLDYTNNPTPGQSFIPTTTFVLTGITVQTNGSLGLTQSENIDLRLTTVHADKSLTNIIAVYANNSPIAFAKPTIIYV